MKLVIDIPDEVLKSKHYCQYFGVWSTKLTETIENSTPYEERSQTEFTDLEKEVTADAINYLLDAELLEENGYTEEVINALKSVLQKLGAEEDYL